MAKKWHTMRMEAIPRLSNNELLKKVLENAGGDDYDYDGCWTDKGAEYYDALVKRLVSELRAHGFLSETFSLEDKHA